MGQINLSILDHISGKKITALVPDMVEMSRLLPALARKISLPADSNGKPIKYKLLHKQSGVEAGDDQTLSEIGVKDGDAVSLIPEPLDEIASLKISQEKLSQIDDIISLIADFRIQIEKMQMTSEVGSSTVYNVSEIDKKITDLFKQLRTELADENAKNYGNFLEEIHEQMDLQKEISISAPVELPTPEQMKVKLIPLHMLGELENARKDENHWSAVAWTLVGSILGVIINWATAETISITGASIVVFVLLAVFSILSFHAAKDFGQRAERVNKEMKKAGIEAEAQLPNLIS